VRYSNPSRARKQAVDASHLNRERINGHGLQNRDNAPRMFRERTTHPVRKISANPDFRFVGCARQARKPVQGGVAQAEGLCYPALFMIL
jgi:hypothetical protein